MDSTKTYMFIFLIIYFGILVYHLIKSKKKSVNLHNYALTDERFPWIIIAVVMAVTMVGPADALALSQKGFKYGLVWAMFPLGAALAQFVSGRFFVGVINERFSGLQTVGAIFINKCSRSSSVAVGLITFIQAIAFSGVLILAGGQVLETFLGIQKELGMIITTVFVGAYTSIGGMVAVMRTDKVQGFFMGGMIFALIVSCCLIFFKGINISGNLIMKSAFSTDYNLRLILTLFSGYFLGELLLPAYCIRAMISKDSTAASRGFTLTSVILAFWYILITFSGSLGQLLPQTGRIAQNNLILLDIIRFHLTINSAVWYLLGGFVFIVFLSLIHSTFDSFLNVGAISFSKDLMGGIVKLSEDQQFWLSKQSTIGIASLGLAIALWKNDLIDILFIGYTVWVPSLLAPLAWILFNKNEKLSPYSFWGGFGIGCLSWLFFEHVWQVPIPSILIGLILNALALLLIQKFSSKNQQSQT